VQVEGTVLRPNAADNFLQMDACFGPDANVTAGADAEAMFRGLMFRGRSVGKRALLIRCELARLLATIAGSYGVMQLVSLRVTFHLWSG
jgi:hypothetical protein